MPKSQNGQVTIAQVAKQAGVSTQTVSRVINNRQEITEETRRRVQEVIEQLGYHPNVLARSLSQRRTHTIGVAASGIEYYGPSRTLIGIDQAATRLGFSISLTLVHDPAGSDVEQVFHTLLSRQVEGIIWQVPEIGENRSWLEQAVRRQSIPIVFTDTHPSKELNTVTMDNFSGGRLAAQHLLAQGYRHIGMIAGPQDWRSAHERMLGWQETLKAAGLEVESRQVAAGDWTSGSGEKAFYQLLETFPEMDAVFAGNDQMALGVYQAAWKLGRSIPADFGLVGFDDIPEAAYFCPQLTTIRQDLYELGSTAVQALAGILEATRANSAEPASKNLLLQPQLVLRQSTSLRK